MSHKERLVDVWKMPDDYLATLEPGTKVCAGHQTNQGIWCGIKSNGIKVVAWSGNIEGRPNPEQYVQTLLDYAKN